MTVAERVRTLVTPLLADLDLDIYDVEHAGGMLRITVDRPGGVDLDTVALATRVISRELDHSDPIPGRYTLEVTSPGIERPLRTPAHFARAVGETVTIRVDAGTADVRRLTGTLQAADEAGCTLAGPDVPGGEVRIGYDQIERARTVFEWGPAPRDAKSERVKRP